MSINIKNYMSTNYTQQYLSSNSYSQYDVIRTEIDSNGNIIKQSYAADDEQTVGASSIFEYNDNGDLAKIGFDFDSDGEDIEWTEYQYDKAGNITKETEYDSKGKKTSELERGYDETGNVRMESLDADGDGKIDDLKMFKYDEQGNITRAIEDEDGDGKADSLNTFEYDKQGNLTKGSSYDGSGKLEESFEYEYDEKGNITKKSYDYDGDGKIDYILGY